MREHELGKLLGNCETRTSVHAVDHKSTPRRTKNREQVGLPLKTLYP